MQHIVVVNASSKPLRTRENFRRALGTSVVTIDAQDATYDDYPTQNVSGVVISGSESSVLDGGVWMDHLETYVLEMHEHEVPLLGVCWGHQFLAQTFGGRVERLPEREIGLQTVKVVGDSAVLVDFEAVQTVFETHEDGVVAVPPGAAVTAENDVGIQSFVYGDSVFGVQFHPEFEREDMQEIFGKYLDSERAAAELSRVTADEFGKFERSLTVFERFVSDVCGLPFSRKQK